MKNKKITRKISQGMYVLTTNGGGCIVDAVSQVSAGDNPYISVAVMKSNYTNELLVKNQRFALSVIGEDINPDIIKIFGLNSMRNINKYDQVSTFEVEGVPVVEDSLGYIVCEVVDTINTNTHTLFIGKMIEADVLKEQIPMTYAYYQEHKDDLLKVTTQKNQTVWICSVCGYVYYGETLPNDFRCPACGVDKDMFERK